MAQTCMHNIALHNNMTIYIYIYIYMYDIFIILTNAVAHIASPGT